MTFRPPLTYLACPYSHCDGGVRQARYEAATKAAAWLVTKFGYNVFSPITHSHPLATIGGLRSDWKFWKRIDTEYLECSERIVVLTLPGWEESEGVTEEIEIMKRLRRQVIYMEGTSMETFQLCYEQFTSIHGDK